MNGKRWKTDQGPSPASKVTVQTNIVAHGRYAARASLDSSGGGWARIQESETFPSLGSTLWGRAYFYFENPVPSHTTYISAMVGDQTVFEIGGGDRWGLNYYPRPFNESPTDTQSPIPKQEWVCLEWRLKAGGDSDWVQLFVNGQLIRSWTPGVGYENGPFTGLALGIDNHDAQPGQVMYFDEIALDSSRIGCIR